MKLSGPVFAFLLAAGAAQGEGLRLPTIEASGSPLQELATTDQIRPFAAVGRLDTGNGFCTATLIASDLILTAAHCLFDARDESRRPDTDFIFNAALRNGRVSAQRGVRVSYVHPEYGYGEPDELDRVRTDLAVLQLDRPIVDSSVVPITVSGRAGRGDAVEVVSYGEDRAEAASLEQGCEVLGTSPGVHMLSCSAVHGSSGSPVMVRDVGGLHIVAVISAVAHQLADPQTPVSLAAATAVELDRVLDLARVAPPAVSANSGLPRVRTIGGDGDGRTTAGALFIRP